MVRSARRFFLLSFASLLAALPAAAQTPWPQDTKNPSLVIEAIPLPSNYMNMGIAFLPDGRMALANAAVETTNGEIPPVSANSNVLLVSGLGAGDMAGISVKKIADMFHQPAGVVRMARDQAQIDTCHQPQEARPKEHAPQPAEEKKDEQRHTYQRVPPPG